MGKKLAIKGHPTRGKEVIELLKMMGGRDVGVLKGNHDYYVIDECENNLIKFYGHNYIRCHEFVVFTLEEFLEKYPFKVGDYVRIPEYELEVRICKMKWTSFSDFDYLVYHIDDEEWYTAAELLEYNDNPQRCLDTDCCRIKSLDNVYSIARCNTTGQGTYAIKIADGYKFDGIDENGNIIVKSIKPKYPTTYDECCDMLNADEFVGYELMTNFPKLINARNAYWKIAGEEMGLDKPWEPDWTNLDQLKYCIWVDIGEFITMINVRGQHILAFPTEEMRDAFFKNFKKEIEQCKELL